MILIRQSYKIKKPEVVGTDVNLRFVLTCRCTGLQNDTQIYCPEAHIMAQV